MDKLTQVKAAILILLTFLLTKMSHAQDSVSVLFIGNSYTYVNDLPNVTKLLAESLGKELTIGSKTNGGYSFANHGADPLTYTSIHQQNWDVVILQDQSQMPAFPDEQVNMQTIPYLKRLADSVYSINSCSNLLLYMTWGRENGDPQWEPISTFNGMNQRLYNAYMRMADTADAMVSPVGAVWKYVRDNHPSIQLYSGDGSHPSMAGTYLAAATFYTALFMESPSGSTYTAGLDITTAQQLRDAVETVMMDSLGHFKIHPVNEPVQAEFTWSQTDNTVSFQNGSTRGEEWRWEFGDGSWTNEENPVHDYTAIGNYEVMLIAGNGCYTDTAIHFVEIQTVGLNEERAYGLIEYNDRFEVKGEFLIDKAEIYDVQGRLAGTVSKPGNKVVKIIPFGVVVFYFNDGKIVKKRFLKS